MSSTQVETITQRLSLVGTDEPLKGSKEPIKLGSALDKYERFDVTTNIGTEFKNIQLSEVVKDDQKIKDLAILVSQRNVVFFRDQDISIEDQKTLAHKLGVLTGKPAESGLHIHPLTNETSKLGDEVNIISNQRLSKPVSQYGAVETSKLHSRNIHSDITYEKWGTDYAILKLVAVPESGGDTLWFSGYELYDRLTPPFRTFLEGLTAEHDAEFFHPLAEKLGFKIRENVVRGHPQNIGGDLSATHPLIRTNPVTGWKSVYISHGFTKRINGLSRDESDLILGYLFKVQAESHDFAVRFKWNPNDVAIWDNRSSFHSATYDTVGTREGHRAVSIAERPYFDPKSSSRREALGLPIVY